MTPIKSMGMIPSTAQISPILKTQFMEDPCRVFYATDPEDLVRFTGEQDIDDGSKATFQVDMDPRHLEGYVSMYMGRRLFRRFRPFPHSPLSRRGGQLFVSGFLEDPQHFIWIFEPMQSLPDTHRP